MSPSNTTSLTARYFLGVAVAMVLGLGAFFASQHQQGEKQIAEKTEGRGREVATSLTANQGLSRLTAADRTRLAQTYLNQRCVNKTGKEVSCGYRNWTNGDSNYNWDPYMNQIPRGAKARVDIKCDPSTRKFNTVISFTNICYSGNKIVPKKGQQCDPVYFSNPYNYSLSGPFSQRPQPWPTSPGKWSRSGEDVTNLGGSPPEYKATILQGGSKAVTEHHVVSDAKDWEGAWMEHTIWLKGDFAAHGSNGTTGYPESKGCFRWGQYDAKGAYNLVRRIGTANMDYYFHGYGPNDPKYNRPACSFSSDDMQRMGGGLPPMQLTSAQQAQQRQASVTTSRNAFGFLGRLFNKVLGRRNIRYVDQNGNPVPAPQVAQ